MRVDKYKQDKIKGIADIADKINDNAYKERELAARERIAKLGRVPQISQIAAELRVANPSLSVEASLERASEISGYKYRTDASTDKAIAAAVQKVESDFKHFSVFPENSPTRINAEKEKRRRIDEIYRSAGKLPPPELSGGEGWKGSIKSGAK